MAIKLSDFKIKNQRRGTATVRASFSVDLGVVKLSGFDLVALDDGRVFVVVPNRRYQTQSGEWRRFNFVHWNGERGNQLKNEVEALANREYLERSGGQVSQPSQGFHGQQNTNPVAYNPSINQSQQSSVGGSPFDDDLPF